METERESPPLRAVIYCRISKDRGGEGLGVDRQREDCLALAKRLGWEVVGVYVDNDISAYSGKPRPEYRAMLSVVRSGAADAILAWHPDRLYRRLIDLEEIVRIAENHHLQIATVAAGDVNLSTSAGRTNARIIAAVAQGEVENTKTRIQSQKDKAAKSGRYRGGPRPYGFDKDGVTVREEEAAMIRRATKEVLAGRPLSAVARDLTAEGYKTATGRPWVYNNLRDMLIRPRNAGLISSGRPERGKYEIVGPAEWPAIISEDEWRALVLLFRDSDRRAHTSTTPRWLGSQTYLCGVCGSVMRPTSKVEHEDGCDHHGKIRKCECRRRYYYRCAERNHLSIHGVKTDEFVRGVMVALLRDPRVIAGLCDDGDDATLAVDREQRRILSLRLDAFESDYDAGLITGAQLKKATDTVTRRIEAIDARMTAELQRSVSSPVLRAPDPGSAFREAPVDVQRALLRQVLRVEIVPAAKRGLAWYSDRVVITPHPNVPAETR